MLRWSNFTDAALKAATKALYEDAEHALYETVHTGKFNFAIHQWRADATNKSCFHKKKLHVAVVNSTYCVHRDNNDIFTASRQQFCDVQIQ